MDLFLSPLFHVKTFLKNLLPCFAWHQNPFCPYYDVFHFLTISFLDAPLSI